jgi:FHA domain-containing protein
MSNRTTAKKALQNFYVRTTLWKLFELRSQEMDCSVDYLINEAMRLYATTHSFLDGEEPDEAQTMVPPESGGVSEALKSTVSGRARVNAPAPPVPRPGAAPAPPEKAATAVPRPSGPPPPRPSRPPAAPAPAPAPPRPPGTGTGGKHKTLTLVFQGNKIPISAGQFIIGRGSKSADLAIKDANISRKHAAIIFHNGAYYLKDLGSTNGVEFNGKQVDSKRIDEGDVFAICGYEIHFTYTV